MLRSRYHDCGVSTMRSTARAFTVSGARPGGTPRHFWVPLYARSTRHSSISSGIPPSEVTQSTSRSASPLFAPSSAMSLRTPVEVSACTTAMTLGDGCASSNCCGSMAFPQATSTRCTVAPARDATSHMRPPNTPFTPMTTSSPGRTTLTNAASMPAEPVALTGNVNWFAVRNTVRSRSFVSSSNATNSGSR